MRVKTVGNTTINIIRRVTKFEPLPIVPMHSKNNTRYFVFDKKDALIGAFNFSSDGALSEVRLDESIKRTKKGAAALLSIRDFVIEQARKVGIPEIRFTISLKKRDTDNLRRLCGKFHVTEKKLFNGLFEYVGKLNPKNEFESMSRASSQFTAQA